MAAKRLSSDIGTPAMVQMVRRGWIDDTPEIRDVWERFRADRNAADFQRLVQHYSPMVLHIVMRERKRLPHFYRDGLDENLSDGLAAMMRWFMSSPAGMSIPGILFWAIKAIRQHIRRAAFKAEGHRQTCSLDAPLDGEDMRLGQTVAIDTPAPFEPIANAEFVRLVMRGLAPRDKKIVRRMMQGFSGVEIGKALGVSRQRAHQLIDRLTGTLRNRADLADYAGIKVKIGNLPGDGETERHSRGASVRGLHQGMQAVQDPERFLRAG